MKLRHALLAAGLLIAGWLAFFGDKTPSSSAAVDAADPHVAQQRRVTLAAHPAKRRQAPADVQILALRARTDMLGQTAGTRGVALFGSQSWNPPPPPPPKAVAPAPPAAPPLPFTYLGKKQQDAAWEVYLARGDQTYIVRPGSVLDGIYRVDAAAPPTLTVTYLPLGQKQTLAIGEAN